MNRYVYALFDKVSLSYMPVFEAINDNVAVRNVLQSMEMNKISDVEDFELVCLFRINVLEEGTPDVELKTEIENRKVKIVRRKKDG